MLKYQDLIGQELTRRCLHERVHSQKGVIPSLLLCPLLSTQVCAQAAALSNFSREEHPPQPSEVAGDIQQTRRQPHAGFVPGLLVLALANGASQKNRPESFE